MKNLREQGADLCLRCRAKVTISQFGGSITGQMLRYRRQGLRVSCRRVGKWRLVVKNLYFLLKYVSIKSVYSRYMEVAGKSIARFEQNIKSSEVWGQRGEGWLKEGVGDLILCILIKITYVCKVSSRLDIWKLLENQQDINPIII